MVPGTLGPGFAMTMAILLAWVGSKWSPNGPKWSKTVILGIWEVLACFPDLGVPSKGTLAHMCTLCKTWFLRFGVKKPSA